MWSRVSHFGGGRKKLKKSAVRRYEADAMVDTSAV